MTVLPLISTVQNQRVIEIINKFLWGKKRVKIPISVLQIAKEKGGLRLTCLEKCQKALRIQWIKRIMGKLEWQYIYEELNPDAGEMIWKCNINKKDVKVVCNSKTGFWVETLQIWSECHFHQPQNVSEVKNQVIWLNSLIKVKGKPVRINQHLINVLTTLKDILTKDETRIMTYDEFKAKCYFENTKVWIWLWYTGLVKAIPENWKHLLKNDTNVNINENISGNLDWTRIQENKYVSRLVYRWLINKLPDRHLQKYLVNWCQVTGETTLEFEEYLRVFQLIYRTTNNIKLRDFQYRLLLGKIYTNVTLKKWNIVNDDTCNVCNQNEIQTVRHLFWECHKVKEIWAKL